MRSHRWQLGLTQQELASRAEMQRTYLGGLERGTRNATFQVLRRVATALEMRVSELLATAEPIEGLRECEEP